MFDPPEDSPVQRFTRSVVPSSKKVKDQVFAFDRVFDENTTQSEVYEGTTRNLLDSVLDGYNATVFAYGATGCGKTHTITGTSQQPGIIFLTMQELFEKIDERSQEKSTEISLSYLEIYNETIRDLLVPGGSKQGLMLREDSNQAVTVSGLTSHHPRDVQEVMDMIVQGNEYRTVSPTEANATSSRSHAVLQINIAQKDRNADVNEPHTMATLSIIDLAGSERASVTKNRGERLTEGANINKSLLALGSCINALCDRRQKAHVPYRNSKLTRLLKFSLGGNCKTVMIVCVSPSSAHFDESQNTLRYANRAKNIQTKVTRNVFNVNRHVKDFLVKIDEQMALINELRAQQKDAENLFLAKFRKQSEKRDLIAREGIMRIKAAYDNAATERQDRINCMKKLKVFERRISLLSGWIAAFDVICDQRGGDEDSMPQSLVAIRRTAQGILVELETSRQHTHQKLEKSSWERSIDTALAHGLRSLEGGDSTDMGEVGRLQREVELIKVKFDSEAYREVLEQEKTGDAAVVQSLLTAQFELLASLSETLSMDEEEAITHAKGIIHRLLQTGCAAASQVVKPDGSLPTIEALPPLRKGTPKKKSSQPLARPVPMPALMVTANEQVHVSPMKSSPRRRKAGTTAKKGVSFTPVKKVKKGGVRWRDDENEEGTLADFEKTPQMVEPSPPKHLLFPDKTFIAPIMSSPPPPKREPAVQIEPTIHEEPTTQEEPSPSIESPSIEVPEMSSLPAAKPSRFQAGFLSKGTRKSSGSLEGSPSLKAPSLSLNLGNSSPSGVEKPSPLRSLDIAKAGNLSPPSMSFQRRAKSSPQQSLQAVADENNPPSQIASWSGSDSESGSFDTSKLRSAMHTANKARRVSIMTGASASNARRISSFGSANGDRSLGPRPSMPGSLSHSTNGISRHRRSSSERRRSPPLTCSPPEYKTEKALTAGQARRMNLAGSLKVENNRDASPLEARRATIGAGAIPAGVHKRQEGRASMAMR